METKDLFIKPGDKAPTPEELLPKDENGNVDYTQIVEEYVK